MARGNSKAQSELPSGYEAGRSEISKLNDATSVTRGTMKYAANWDKTSELKVSSKGFKFGDGVVGNGIIKDGELHLRDEDIEDIVNSNFVSDQITETIEYGGGDETPLFAPFTGINNVADKDEKGLSAFNVEFTSFAHDYPDGNDVEVADFEPGQRATGPTYSSGGEPGYGASGSLSIGDGSSAWNWIQVDYDKVMARAAGPGEKPITMERDSAKRLAKAIEARINQAAEYVAESKAEDFDFDEYAENHRNDYESERDDDY